MQRRASGHAQKPLAMIMIPIFSEARALLAASSEWFGENEG